MLSAINHFGVIRVYVFLNIVSSRRLIITMWTVEFQTLVDCLNMNLQIVFSCRFVITLGTWEGQSLMHRFNVNIQMRFSWRLVITLTTQELGSFVHSLDVLAKDSFSRLKATMWTQVSFLTLMNCIDVAL